MKRKKFSRKKCLDYLLVISICSITIGLFAFVAGSEFRVNNYNYWKSDSPDIAIDQQGNFVITWASYGSEPEDEIFAQRYNADGRAVGKVFQVNKYTLGQTLSPAIAMDKDGDFVITWQAHGQDGSFLGVTAQRFHKDGKAVGREFVVTTYTSSHQSDPDIAMDWDGNFIITWSSGGQDGYDWGVFAQRFNRKGKPLGSEFQVNSYADNAQFTPAIAMAENGNFVITWASWLQDGYDWGVFAQRYNSKGEPLGNEFQVNTFMKWYQWHPAIAMDRKGNFVITWSSEKQDGSSFGIFAHRFNKNGEALGTEFQVNTYTKKSQDYPAVAMDNGGNFVISWESQNQDGSGTGIFAQMFTRKGNAVGDEFQVNTYTRNLQALPAIAMKKKNKFIMTWVSDNQDGSDWGVFARMFLKWARGN
ncbi:MAG: hypothetical protein WBE11_08780 [Candidatus Aminicenantaceae bacterium]